MAHRPTPLKANPRLLDNGEPHPECIFQNLQDYGYVCPRREFIESPNPPSMLELQRKWKAGVNTLHCWKRDQDWDEQRGREWTRIHDLQWALTGDAIAAVRETSLAEQRGQWLRLSQMLDAKIRKGYEEDISPTGEMKRRDYSAKEIQTFVATLEIINRNLNETMGLSNVLVREAEKKGLNETSAPQVRVVRYNMQDPAALPESNIPVIEGEIIKRDELQAIPVGREKDVLRDMDGNPTMTLE